MHALVFSSPVSSMKKYVGNYYSYMKHYSKPRLRLCIYQTATDWMLCIYILASIKPRADGKVSVVFSFLYTEECSRLTNKSRRKGKAEGSEKQNFKHFSIFSRIGKVSVGYCHCESTGTQTKEVLFLFTSLLQYDVSQLHKDSASVGLVFICLGELENRNIQWQSEDFVWINCSLLETFY